MLRLSTFVSPLLDTNCYLLADDLTHEAVIIDAPYGAADLITPELTAADLKLTMIILTHGHFDHTLDAPSLKQRFDAPIYIHEADSRFLRYPQEQGIPFQALGIEVPSIEPDYCMNISKPISIGSVDYQLIETPGHTPGGICLYSADENRLFSGDTLFAGTWGRTDFTGGNDAIIQASLIRLNQLPADTAFYPGHGSSSTIGAERWLNQLSVD